MTALLVVWGVVLVCGGAALARFGFTAMRRRPGWGGMYGRGSLLTLLGGMIVLAGVVNLTLAFE